MSSSYFDYFRENIKTEKKKKQVSDDDEILRGTCDTLCPQEEVKLRESEKMVHVLEVVGTEKKLVKSYCRPAANYYMAVPSLLRPYPILINTIQYLLLEVTRRKDVPQSVVYNFIGDRLRAVRQDMIIQRLPPEECVHLLEPMVRFYLYYGYSLCNLPLKDFDPVLNRKYLLECTKWCLSSYDKILPKQDRDIMERLTDFFCNMDINLTGLGLDRIIVESVYILCNLNDVNPKYRFYKLPKHLRRDIKLQLAYHIAIATQNGNYIRACRLIDKLCPVTYCAGFSSLPKIQRYALMVLSSAYHNKRLTVPCRIIAKWFKFADAKEAARVCAHYGLKVENEEVLFDRTAFKVNADMHILTTKDLRTKFNLRSVADMFTYPTA